MKRNIFNFIAIALLVSCSSGRIPETERDTSLVVPGKSCEGFYLGEAASLSGYTVIIESHEKKTPPAEVLSRHLPSLEFNRIAYMRNRYILFLHDGTVKAVAGLSSINRVTDGAARLSDGIENFILNYGNTELEIIRDGGNRIYLYRRLGIALFDDYGDDSIDMYLVFTPEQKTPAE